QHAGVKRVTLRAALTKPISGSIQRFRVHGINDDVMVEQSVHDSPVGAFNRCPQGDDLSPPQVQFSSPLVQALAGVGSRASGDLRPHFIHDPNGMRLIRLIDADVVAHSSSSWPWACGGGAGTAGSPYTSPPGGHFLLNLRRRSLADRDTLLLSLCGLGGKRAPCFGASRCTRVEFALSAPFRAGLFRRPALAGARGTPRVIPTA